MKIYLLFLFLNFAPSVFSQQDSIVKKTEPFNGLLILDSAKYAHQKPVVLNNGPSFLQVTNTEAMVYIRGRKSSFIMEGKLEETKVVALPDSIISSWLLIGQDLYKGKRTNLEVIELFNHEIVVHIFWPLSGQDGLYYGHLASQEEENYLREYFK